MWSQFDNGDSIFTNRISGYTRIDGWLSCEDDHTAGLPDLYPRITLPVSPPTTLEVRCIHGIGLWLKIVPECLIIRQALEILQKKDLLKLFWLAELFQIVYIVLVGFAGFFKLFKWKPNA